MEIPIVMVVSTGLKVVRYLVVVETTAGFVRVHGQLVMVRVVGFNTVMVLLGPTGTSVG